MLRFRLLLGLATLLAAGDARANGSFPLAGKIILDPEDPQHLVAEVTFGLVVSRDGGASWDWICEAAMGYANLRPPIALAPDGSVLLGNNKGIYRSSAEACSWELAPGPTTYVPDLTAVRAVPGSFLAFTSVAEQAQLWSSTDAGASWTAGPELGFYATTVEVAPSNPERIYLSGLAGEEGALLRSSDGGETWTTLPIPGSDVFSQPYIGAVDPADEDVVYVRLNAQAGRLVVTHDGGDSWTEAFAGGGLLKAFALSPDGSRLLVGGPDDEVWGADASDLEFSVVSPARPLCLAWTERGVYACGLQLVDGFLIGHSPDGTGSYEPVVTTHCVRGPLDCEPDTTVATECEWEPIAQQLETDKCSGGGGAGGGAGGEGEGGAPGTGGSPAAPATPPLTSGDGCACHAARQPPPAPWGLLVLAALRRRPRARGCAQAPRIARVLPRAKERRDR